MGVYRWGVVCVCGGRGANGQSLGGLKGSQKSKR